MKVIHIMRFVAHGGLSPEDMTSGNRGLTGTEQTLIAFAEASAGLGHRVVVYVPTPKPFLHNGVWYMDVEAEYPRLAELDGADVVVAWLSADPLHWLPDSVFRVHVLQINDWSMCSTGPETNYAHVDRFIAQSRPHAAWLWGRAGSPKADERIIILPNGVWTQRYPPNPVRTRHRLITCSSPDRGLHILLHLWPAIRQAAPDATLHVFYEVRKWIQSCQHVMSEIGQRARYIADRLTRLEGHGVHLRNAVPPMTLAAEMSKSDFYVFPTWTILFTEGFSVSTLEACAAGTVPIISDMDALGEIYRDSGAIIVPIGERRTAWIDAYRDRLIEMLLHGRVEGENLTLEERRLKCRRFAEAFDFSIVGAAFQGILDEGIRAKKEKADGGAVECREGDEGLLRVVGGRGSSVGPGCA